ncbi:MAG: AI-2E family transporter [Eubacterium sp.]|nr:AI-2E family transporter [Eubacterium sp.]
MRRMMTLAGAGCIIVLFYLCIGKIGIFFSMLGTLLKAMTPILIGCFLAFVLNPIVNKFRIGFRSILGKMFKKTSDKKLMRISDVLAVVFALIFFLALIAAFFYILIPQLYESMNSLYNNIDKYSENISNFAKRFMKDNNEKIELLNSYLGGFEKNLKEVLAKTLLPNMNNIVKTVSSGIIGGIKMIFDILVGLIAAVYILMSKDTFSAQGKKVIYSIFKRDKGNKVLGAIDYIDSVFSGFIYGKIVDSLIIGLICFIFCTLVGMPYTILVSVIIGVTNIIPFFGPFIGAIPSAFLVLVESPKMCLVFVIFVIILQQIDGNIIGPLILGDSTGLSSFWVLFAIMVGGNLFGFAGMVLGVPTFACIYALFTIILRDGLNKKGLANNTEFFVALRSIDENGNPVKGPKKRYESKKTREKREKKLEQLQHSKEIIGKVTHLEKADKTEKPDKAEKVDKADKAEKSNKTNKTDK